jgi:sarcosine oxidase subunit beta
VLKTDANGHLKEMLKRMEEAGIPYEEWDRSRIRDRLPFWDLHLFAPPRHPEDAGFGETKGG